jgi:hypothetical protein
MSRRVDPGLTGRALRIIRRVQKQAAAENRDLSDWEKDFLASVEERLERFGSAFADPDKGALCGPLSLRQGLKLKQIGKKAYGEEAVAKPQKARKPWRRKIKIKQTSEEI